MNLPSSAITELAAKDAPLPLQTPLRCAGIERLWMIGSSDVLVRPFLGLFCSLQCPGSVVIKTFDAIRELRDAGVIVAGGFHSPMERDCLDFLLRGKQPVIICPAKGLGRFLLPASWRAALGAGRLLIVTPFPESVRRTTVAQAQARNEFVAAMAGAVLVPHAAPGGKAESTARNVIARGQPLFTFRVTENRDLLDLGAKPYSCEDAGVAAKVRFGLES